MIKHSLSILFLSAVLATGCGSKEAKTEYALAAAPTSAVALERLKEGNERFLKGETIQNELGTDLKKHEAGQKPYAIILSCADSRVPVERLFDAGVGELFVLRVAGNVATEEMIGSSEFGVAALGAPLIVVMGHESCGAVVGAQSLQPELYPDELQGLLEGIREDLDELDKASASLAEATEANARHQVSKLMESPVISGAVEAGTLKIVPAVYAIGSGKVTFLE
ncbi:MAG: carbonic anhydrase [Candidatus Sumerlaeia bacterium]|nr:carbonic anhydrase [Candidatus Sumerlaeia bacterium]